MITSCGVASLLFRSLLNWQATGLPDISENAHDLSKWVVMPTLSRDKLNAFP
jgi:hypothetical protein